MGYGLGEALASRRSQAYRDAMSGFQMMRRRNDETVDNARC